MRGLNQLDFCHYFHSLYRKAEHSVVAMKPSKSDNRSIAKAITGGFVTGMLLQVAVGPVFFFVLNVAIQRTLTDGILSAVAVTVADYAYIALAIVGVGNLIRKEPYKSILGFMGALILVAFGVLMAVTSLTTSNNPTYDRLTTANYASSFAYAFLLTVSSPLTIVFWTGLFATRATEREYDKVHLVGFGLGAGASTFTFLTATVLIVSLFRASIPLTLMQPLNASVGLVIVAYGIVRTTKFFLRSAGED